MSRPPHRTHERESTMLEGRQPATVELLEYYEDSPSGREHLWPSIPPTRPGLGFDTPEDRNRVRELLLRIEDLEHEGKLKKMRELAEAGIGDQLGPRKVMGECLLELLEALDTMRSEDATGIGS